MAEILDVSQLRLSGRHLIEASAGTGKTFNITRIYLRLLLEKQLSVRQILVMTFSNAATEELRGRIDSELRQALLHWSDLITKDTFYQQLDACVAATTRERLLRIALLEMDDAAIFTIHGFCHHVLRRYAFSSALSMDKQLQSDTEDLLLQAVQNWYRRISQAPERFQLLIDQGCETPEKFYQDFRQAIRSQQKVQVLSPEQYQQQLKDDSKQKTDSLSQEKQLLRDQLKQVQSRIECINDEKAKKKDWQAQWQNLRQWLSSDEPQLPDIGNFLDGRRAANKDPEIKTWITQCRELLKQHRKIHFDADRALEKYQQAYPFYQLVGEAIQNIREQFSELKQQQDILDFDDLIRLLHDNLKHPENSHLAGKIRSDYPLALVDEFQDTDPLQYGILEQIYPPGHKDCALFMIGDPKQAIYGFRGGDIYTYLRARDQAHDHWYMDTNWRSLPEVVSGYNRLFHGAPLNENSIAVFGEAIEYIPVGASPKAAANQTPLVDPASDYRAINYFYIADDEQSQSFNRDDWYQHLALWCVHEVNRLLREVTLDDSTVAQKDIAFLVRTAKEAQIIRETLAQYHYASVYLSEKENIFDSPEANELLLLLNGILNKENQQDLIAALSTRLLGGSIDSLKQLQDDDNQHLWEQHLDKIAGYARLWQQEGILAMLIDMIKHDYQPPPQRYERALSNMMQLAEILQQAAMRLQQPRQLLRWYQLQIEQIQGSEQAQIRLESDAELIKIITMHGSKGLEYPIVFIPFAASYRDPLKSGNRSLQYFQYHQPPQFEAQLQIGETPLARQYLRAEAEAEAVRLLYVAITRASHRCYLGVSANGKNHYNTSHLSALAQIVSFRQYGNWQDCLRQLCESASHSSKFWQKTVSELQQLEFTGTRDAPHHDTLQAARFEQPGIHYDWQLRSFSSLNRMKPHWMTYDIAAGRLDAEQTGTNTDTQAASSSSIAFSLKKGARTGSLLHQLLEQIDFSQPNTDLITQTAQQLQLDKDQLHAFEQWFSEILKTPIQIHSGNTVDSLSLTAESASEARNFEYFSLQKLKSSQILKECEFYFPIHELDTNGLKTLVNQQRQFYPFELAQLQQCSGMMKGYIDLIFSYQGRYYVADYKSSHLGYQPSDYSQQMMRKNNEQQDYDLQYYIYALALHRFLQQKLGQAYRSEQHFGGVYYFYLRGMSSQHPPQSQYGIFYQAIETPILEKLDTVFGGRS